MSLILNNGNKGADFEPDAFLDEQAEYEARLVGICEVGTHENADFDDSTKINKILTCLVTYELVEEETRVTRGAEGSEYTVPRFFTNFVKFSSHELSGLTKQCKAANSESVTKDGLDMEKALGYPVMLKLKTNKKGDRQNIASTSPVPVKFRSAIAEMESKPFLYTCITAAGAHVGTIEDVPLWNLRYAVNGAIDAEQFANLEAIEDLIEADGNSSKTSGTELEGDRAPKEEKKPAKKAAAKKEEKVVEETPTPAEEKPKSKRAPRKSKAKVEESVDEYADLDEAALEDMLLEKGLDEAVLDTISEEADSDEAYLTALKAKLKSL